MPCRSVDSFVTSTGIVPDLLLIDVEHAEGRGLRGMHRLLSTRQPPVIIEMHGAQAIIEALSALQKHGYRLMSTDLKSVEAADVIPLGHYVAIPPGFTIAA